MATYYAIGSPTTTLDGEALRTGLTTALDALGRRKQVLAIPPDITRFHSHAGPLTGIAYDYFGQRLTDVMPAVGTHFPMTDTQLDTMYPEIPKQLIRIHRWRDDVVTVGEVPADFVRATTHGSYDQAWPAQVNRLVVEGGHDLILSIGQVVPHEVIGMANYNKNILVGTGGERGINESHFISAAAGIENVLGRADNPVRRILNYAHERFLAELPIVFALTVIGTLETGGTVVRGLFVGDDLDCFQQACRLAEQVNITLVDECAPKVVAYLDPEEFHSTWISNKAIYRTRMAIADGGELVVLAPGVRTFGEDPEIDRLIRKYGYRTTPEVLQLVAANPELQRNLGTPAHLMHSTPENRFRVTYCPGSLTQAEIEGAGFDFGDVQALMTRYNPDTLQDGWNRLADGERIYFVRNPALGLWSHKDRFNAAAQTGD